MISAVNCRPLNGFFLPSVTMSPSQRTQRHSPSQGALKAATEPYDETSGRLSLDTGKDGLEDFHVILKLGSGLHMQPLRVDDFLI
jgi:hypothetical protein